MKKPFIKNYIDTKAFQNYRTWEIPVSTFNSNPITYQICYISLEKNKAAKALRLQAIPINTIAYEYADEIQLKDNEVILAVEINTHNRLDLTHKPDYDRYIKMVSNGLRLSNDIPLIKAIEMDEDTGHYRVVYKVRNNSCIRYVNRLRR